MEIQLSLLGNPANERLVGKVFEYHNKVPSPCDSCLDKCDDELCIEYKRWAVNDGKDIRYNRYGERKKYLP